jgi:prepilin-type processing-associated H-X9-DG protein/prepilin-type N-terminal cleavage/methylation domain-containing protein
MKHRKHKTRGMTLTELLVVIALLALLAAFLFPVFRATKEKARQASCESNLRQIGMALLVYAQDNNERYPSMNAWMNRQVMPPVLACPSVSGEEDTGRGYPGYAYSMATMGDMRTALREGRLPEDNSLPVGAVKHPANTIVVIETIPRVDMAGSVPPMVSLVDREQSEKDCHGDCDKNLKSDGLMDTMAGSIRHNGGVNYLFFDGHVKWLTPSPWMANGGLNDGTYPTLSL